MPIMDPVHVESAVSTAGEAAIFIRPLPVAPEGAALIGRRVVLMGPAGDRAFRIAREVAAAARSRRRLLVIEIADGRVVRDAFVPIRGGSGWTGTRKRPSP